MEQVSLWQRIKGWLFHFFPHHLISRLMLMLSRLEIPLAYYAIRLFVRVFKVNLAEAETDNLRDYPSFNAFFTRALKPEVRPIAVASNIVVSPCDGYVMQIGKIAEGRIIQAKNHDYSVAELLTPRVSDAFAAGVFCTIYLGPSHYHRVHAPLTSQLRAMIHVPGRLFSVAPYATRVIPRLYTKNERVISVFDTEHGTAAVVMVGAVNVSAIETVWHGLVSPATHALSYHRYGADNSAQPTVALNKGDEMGRFNIGSTVILLINNENINWNPLHHPGSSVQMGCELASII
ncbi:MAG: phosphatidylserine decarboxylase [Chromatiales bacterium]|nr:phosphatidylserine decarboxylase [Chromatiales bacterium]